MANRGIAGLEIYFEDLTPEAQRAVLDYLGINAENRDLDTMPLTIIE